MSPHRLSVREQYVMQYVTSDWPHEAGTALPSSASGRQKSAAALRRERERRIHRFLLGTLALVTATVGLWWVAFALSFLQVPGVHVFLDQAPLYLRYGDVFVFVAFALIWWRYAPVSGVLRKAGVTFAALAFFLASLPIG